MNHYEHFSDDPMLTAKQAATDLGLGLSTFWRDVGAGLLPRPYYVAPKAPRWRRSEIKAAAAARPRQSSNSRPRAQGMPGGDTQPK